MSVIALSSANYD